ncbi:hypothetical protein CspHIS471_0602160 [Cutaneotrichosporon sp. HIS471]|nr:hypothetical protein CspHIS471_0602160 [Cutaneotrichosporon sp. HIS471]
MAKSVRSTDVQLGAFGLVAVLCTVKLPIDLYIISSLEQLSSTILSKTPERSYCIQFTGPARAICGEAYFTGRFHWLDIQNKWIPFVYLNIAYTATVLLYIASFLVACGLSRNYDCEWLWVRSDLIILSVLVLFGAGVGAAYANIDWSDTSKTTTGILSESTCGVLGKYCLPARLSVLSVWPIVAATVTVSTAAFLGVAKLGADAYMFMALRNLWLHYREQVEVCFIVHFLVRNRDIEWVWVRSNVVIFLLLVVLGVAAGSTFPFLYWPFDWSPDWKHYTRHPSDESVYSIAVCNDLGNDCIASRLSMIIVWPIAAIRIAMPRIETLNQLGVIKYVSITYAALVIAYLLSCVFLRLYKDYRDVAWAWVRTDLIVFSALAAYGFACGGSFLSLTWTLASNRTSTGNITGYATPVTTSMFSSETCDELANACIPSRLGMIIVWPIATIFAGLAIFELVYVYRYHARQASWCHSLWFLQSVPLHDRGRKGTYARTTDMDDDDLDIDAELLTPFTRYQGQSDSPPVYSDAPSSYADHKAALLGRDALPVPHAALAGRGSYADHKKALCRGSLPSSSNVSLVVPNLYADHKKALVRGILPSSSNVSLVVPNLYADHKKALVRGILPSSSNVSLVVPNLYADHKKALAECHHIGAQWASPSLHHPAILLNRFSSHFPPPSQSPMMNYESTTPSVPSNGYTSQNTTPGLKFDAQNMKTERDTARLAGVPKPSATDYQVSKEDIKAQWKAFQADKPKLGENHW